MSDKATSSSTSSRREHRSRSRSPRSHRHHDRRQRSRSRSPRSHHRSSRRSRSRSRSRERDHRRERDRRERKPGMASPQEEENDLSMLFDFTAAQLADRVIELFSSSKVKSKKSDLEDCFKLDEIAILDMSTEKELVVNSDFSRLYVEGVVESLLGETAVASKRMFLECDRPGAPTYALDFYLRGKSPGLSSLGVGLNKHQPLAVLYRVQKGKITKIFVKEDTESLGAIPSLTEEEVTGSGIFEAVLDLVVRPRELLGAIKRHYHNYDNIPVVG